MGRKTTYNRDVALAILRLLDQGHSLRGAVRILGTAREHTRVSRWKAVNPEFRVAMEMVLVALWTRHQLEDGEDVSEMARRGLDWTMRGIYAPPGPQQDDFWRVAAELAEAMGGPIMLDEAVEEHGLGGFPDFIERYLNSDADNPLADMAHELGAAHRRAEPEGEDE